MSELSLDQVAIKFNTDKSSLHHNYTTCYQKLFDEVGLPNRILEIGVGGETYNGDLAASLKMWKCFLPEVSVVGVDIDPICLSARDEGIEVYIGDQTDVSLSKEIKNVYGETFDLIIDDASHNNAKTIKTFELYFKLLKPSGLYVIEDLHCSYEEKFGNDRAVMSQFILNLVSHVDTNGRKLTPEYAQNFDLLPLENLSYLERWIKEIRISRGLLIILKRDK